MRIKQLSPISARPLTLATGLSPLSIQVSYGAPAKITYSNATESPGICIRCPDSPCIKYAESEREGELTTLFRTDASNLVCAVEAIHLDSNSGTPYIDASKCISCGACASRCPTKAIYFTDDAARVSIGGGTQLVPGQVTEHTETRAQFLMADVVGRLVDESDVKIEEILNKVRKNMGKGGVLNPNLLVRNLIRACGPFAESYPQGVQYNAMDVTFLSENGQISIGEVEVGNSAIENPRSLASIVAVLIARHSFQKDRIVPLSVLVRLPQGREQYWMVIDDIKKVLGIKIQTLSITALFLLIWNRVTLNSESDALFLSQETGLSLRPFLETAIGRKLDISDGFENQLEPSKTVV